MAGKALVQSKSFWGWLPVVIASASEVLDQALDSGFIPPEITPWLVLGGSLLGFFGRLVADEPITSIFPSK